MFWFDGNWQIQQALIPFWGLINVTFLIVAVVLAYYSYKKPLTAVAMTTILLPTYLCRSHIGFLPITFLEVCIVITVAGWLLKNWRSWLKRKASKEWFLIAEVINIMAE